MVTIGQRIKLFREKRDISQSELAQRCGWGSQSRIGNYEANIRKVGVEDAVVIASALHVSPGELLFGTPDNDTFIEIGEKHLPLVSYAQANKFTDPDQLLTPEEVTEYVTYNGAVSDVGFAFRIAGDSMEPDFMLGDTIIVDPMVAPTPGEFVIANDEENEAVFRKYRLKSQGSFELVPLNNDYPIIDSDKQYVTIIGTMIEQRIHRRKR
ncbi:LexA family protein [Xenorhabdus bovienii]|uniref:LexA family protein n=1 Tax=Xenorhabdus bovienii TaxID=40576 RepID=UPI003DA20879